MSWRRIDENTYIDDTLVTCAEYQLFIDEMREKGKYYQPDHWISYQFQKGQAREPILGVRYLDTVAFCQWLTERENEDWEYRLPYQVEANRFRTKQNEKTPLGYWIMSTENQPRFSWIGTIPENPRGIKELGNVIRRACKIRLEDGDFADADDVIAALDYACDRSLLGYECQTKLTRASYTTVAFDYGLLRFARARDMARACTRAGTLSFDDNLARAREPARVRALALDLFIDIYTLEERIAGRSPAFEGIRLVKERIR